MTRVVLPLRAWVLVLLVCWMPAVIANAAEAECGSQEDVATAWQPDGTTLVAWERALSIRDAVRADPGKIANDEYSRLADSIPTLPR